MASYACSCVRWLSTASAAARAASLAVVLALAPAGGGGAARAQTGVPRDVRGPRPDSVLRARGLAGSARVALSAATTHLDGFSVTDYNVAAGASPFVGEHLQVGFAPAYQITTGQSYTYRTYTYAAAVNYVFGGGSRWRGYAGAFGSTTGRTASSGPRVVGGQAGALFFLHPALALRGELRYRTPTSGSVAGRGDVTALVTLDPYVLGRADEGAPSAAGLGVVDVGGQLYYERVSYYASTGVTASVAPYLTRWAQVGVLGQVSQSYADAGGGPYRLRGSGRLYLPTSVRTQPFAEGFAETNTVDSRGGLSHYGVMLGVRHLLNARVALDVGVRRTLQPVRTFGGGERTFSDRPPGRTGVVVGLATRVGRAR